MVVLIHELVPSADGITISVGIEDSSAYAVLGVLGYPSFSSTMVIDADDRLVSAMRRELRLRSVDEIRETLATDSIDVGTRMRSSFARSCEPHQMLGEPVLSGKRFLGAIWASLWTPGKMFGSGDVTKLRLLGRVMALALDDADYATIYRDDGQAAKHTLKSPEETVQNGEPDIDGGVNRSVREMAANADADAFTERELTVLRLIGAGLTSREIAEQLFISPNTVRTHRTNLLNKLGVHSSAAAISKAKQLGLIR